MVAETAEGKPAIGVYESGAYARTVGGPNAMLGQLRAFADRERIRPG
jgi:hypothetical protein